MRKRTTVGPTAVLRAQRSVIAGEFGGQRGAYRQFLQVQGMTPGVALDAIRDQLLEAKIARGLRVAPISGAAVQAFIPAHAGTLTRSVETERPVRWLVGQTQRRRASRAGPARRAERRRRARPCSCTRPTALCACAS